MPSGAIGEAILDKYFPTEEWESTIGSITTGEIKAISDYTGLNFNEVKSLSYVEYLLYRREAWVFNLKQSEQGREFLKSLYRFSQTKADIKAIRSYQEGRSEKC
ncbi:MAG: hypothetical protein RSA01_00500 [Clostridium sp.]|uniref:hypothetical protein n=1 Tax=Clostridium sp. TaxID=1506 RepID=UPI002FCA783A